MTNEVKLRLYITAIVIVMITLYVWPLIILNHADSVRKEFLSSCLSNSSLFEYCWQESQENSGVSLLDYLLPYLPVVGIIWLSWLLKINQRLSEHSYPKRLMSTLLWLGLLATAVAIYVSIEKVVTKDVAELYKITSFNILTLPWLAAAWLSAPVLFHQLIAPTSLSTSMRKGKIALLLLAATPIAAFAIIIVRQLIKNGLSAL